MINCQKTIQQLKVQIKHLKKQNQQFRSLTHELIEAFYKTVNKASESKPESSFNFEQLFKILSNLNPNQPQNNQAAECSFAYFKDFFTKKGKHE